MINPRPRDVSPKEKDEPIHPASLCLFGRDNSWSRIYHGWNSEEIKYYWRKHSLRFSPTLENLVNVSRCSDNPEAAQRATRILSSFPDRELLHEIGFIDTGE